MRRLGLLVAALLLIASQAAATSVVVFRSPSLIVLASDSLLQQQQDDTRSRTRTCKVRQAGRWWVTISGYTGSTSPAFDVPALVGQELAPLRTMAAVQRAMVGQVYPRVREGLEQSRASPGFAHMFQPGDWVQAIVVAGADGPTLTVGVLVVIWQQVDPFTLTAAWLTCPGTWCPDGRLFFGTSVDTAGPTVQRVTAPRPPWVERADSAAARRIITEQIAATPLLVSAPIDILELRAAGAAWALRDPSSTCAPVRPSSSTPSPARSAP